MTPKALGFLALAMGSAWAGGDTQSAGQRVLIDTATIRQKIHSVPLPNGAVCLEKGITGAFMGGKYNKGDEQSLYQWQGEVGYFYTHYFSAGVGFKITAGEPSDSAQKIRNRYFINTRLHKAWSRASVFVGPHLGLDNLNILRETQKDSLIRTPINNTNAGLGLELGVGWKVFRWGGVTLGNNLEYSLVGEAGSANSLNFRISPGVAIDVLAFAHTLKELVPALYVNIEFQVGYLLFESNRDRHDQAAVLGVGLAF